jgi:hypothetical protein
VVEEVLALLDLARKWELEISLEEAQNLMGQILDECVESAEKCWWGDSEGKPLHPNLASLLGPTPLSETSFNLERIFSWVCR